MAVSMIDKNNNSSYYYFCQGDLVFFLQNSPHTSQTARTRGISDKKSVLLVWSVVNPNSESLGEEYHPLNPFAWFVIISNIVGQNVRDIR
jgi:hypothetical protein